MSGSTHFEVSGDAAPSSGVDERARQLARSVFAVVSTKWGLTVLEEVGRRPRRFRELRRSIGTVSDKVLTQTLRDLEAHGLIHRHDHRSANPRVDYTLTDAGRDLVTTVHGLCDWSRAHLDVLLDAPAPGAAD
ncbi:winged helix-turn-helix transcriptional regulator [Gordonia lacunae]|uniref:Transcriptional regulator n=1 Tax=Gordonia lacunae TaxID=417102 RepID=A0A243QG36_9ACTN|nr:helix-turn-helix domain-containing protein [Gordonia lacunae]OUC80708.1 transcriptional regulator [Gordonia lacunae]